jgi:exopolyphosphatase/guanosine-5'-triphosphate,3'-diphosphate pyrophosphatase
MKRAVLGVVDIGSNTIRSLIVEAMPDGTWRNLDDEREMARLAAGLTRQGRLTRAAMRRAVAALKRMAEIARARGVERLVVVATSAIRNAANRRQFVDRVRAETGLRVRVISEEEEAELAFESAARCFDLADRPCAVADVGGGSTEVILALGSHIQQVHSLRLGSVALTEEFVGSDPLRRREFKALRRDVRRRIEASRIEADPPPQFLVASGGTAAAVAQMVMSRQGLAGRPVQGFEMTQAELLHLHQALLRRSLAERREMPGLSPERADIIIAGVTILYELMAHLRVNVLRVSAQGIRHALLGRMIARRFRTVAPPSRPQRLASAEAFARSLRFEEAHGFQVQRLAVSIFDQTAEPLGLDPGGRDLLSAAALLHDVGYVVGFRGHHRHTYRLIAHAPLDGFTPREREIVALVARYHRRAGPRKKHRAWAALGRDDRLLVSQLAAVLRIADALDRRHSQRLKEIRCRVMKGRVRFAALSGFDLGVELHAAEEKSNLFRKVFGREVAFALARAGAAGRAAARPAKLRLVRRLTA